MDVHNQWPAHDTGSWQADVRFDIKFPTVVYVWIVGMNAM